MTLSTYINFREPVDPEALFGTCREIIGIPNEQPFEMETGPDKFWIGRGNDVTQIRSKPGGFAAMLWLTIVPSGKGDYEYGNHEYCEKYSEECHCREWFVQIMLDTTYGYQDEKERSCKELHYDIICELAKRGFRCSEWQDEFTGEWHSELPVKEKV